MSAFERRKSTVYADLFEQIPSSRSNREFRERIRETEFPDRIPIRGVLLSERMPRFSYSNELNRSGAHPSFSLPRKGGRRIKSSGGELTLAEGFGISDRGLAKIL
jgi:hypothetical protein